MGQVYQATDTKLNRQVGEAFANDPDRLARFQREAQSSPAFLPGPGQVFGQGGQVSGRGIYTVTGDERHVLALRAAVSHRGDLMADMKPESEQRTQRQMTLRLVLPLLVLAGLFFVLATLLFEFLDFFYLREVFRRGFP